ADTPRRRYSDSPSPRRRYGRSRSRSRSRSVSRSRSPSKSRSPARRDSSKDDVINPGNNLYVTGLSARVVEKDLEEHFSQEGKVVDCRIVVDPRTRESRGFGFVTMSTLEDAERCVKYLNRSTLEGRIITVEKAKRKRARTPTPGSYLGVRGRYETSHAYLILLIWQLLFVHVLMAEGTERETGTAIVLAVHPIIHLIVEVESGTMTEMVPLIIQVAVIAGNGQGLQYTRHIGGSVPGLSY
ncbi:hypothetical protein KI387_026108, partial [Taxus chinensis]